MDRAGSHDSLGAEEREALVESGGTTAQRSSDVRDLPRMARAVACVVDEIAIGIVLITPERRFVGANRVGRALVAGGAGVRIERGRLEASSPAAQSGFRGAVAEAARGIRRLIELPVGDRDWGLVLTPLEESPAGEACDVAILFESPASSVIFSTQLFGRARGLTAMERHVLEKLADGMCVQGVAAALGSRQNTVRSHVRSLLQKTGQPSLRALVAKVGMLPRVGPRIACVSADVFSGRDESMPGLR